MIEFAHNGMARCGSCGEPVAPVLIGSVADVEANSNIIVRCFACAASEEAEAITRTVVDGPPDMG
jgi:uncharacterized protein (UPF0212 family)